MFRSCQAYADMIWQRWVREYLPQNNVRSQWNKSETNIEVGDLLWLIEDNVKRSQYRIAQIVEIYPGKDGVVRSALSKLLTALSKDGWSSWRHYLLSVFHLKTGPALLAPQISFVFSEKTQVKIERFHVDRRN